FCFSFTVSTTSDLYPLSLHDALPIFLPGTAFPRREQGHPLRRERPRGATAEVHKPARVDRLPDPGSGHADEMSRHAAQAATPTGQRSLATCAHGARPLSGHREAVLPPVAPSAPDASPPRRPPPRIAAPS